QKRILNNYEVIRSELVKHGSGLEEKKEIIVLTKSDLIDEDKIKVITKKLEKKFNKKISSISINDINSLITLKNLLLSEKNKNKESVLKKWSP
ncbi:MAG: hypothetical protein CMP36_00935, partial [Rickettsiales bacterium]